VFRPDLPIKTPRLTLRALTLDDFVDVHAYDSRPDVARYVYWAPRTDEESKTALGRYATRTELVKEGDGLVLGIVLGEAGRVVGQVDLQWLSRVHRTGEIGFIVNPEFRGRGIAVEAAGVMFRLGFEGFGLHRIIGRCDARNLASTRVMERLGMRREAHFIENEHVKGEWTDEFTYAILDREWKASTTAPAGHIGHG
jgi:RimJ/RimL family protein N-acetyltransferase